MINYESDASIPKIQNVNKLDGCQLNLSCVVYLGEFALI